MQQQRWANHNHRTARIIYALAQQVLAETALLALEHIRQAFQAMFAFAAHRTTAPPVVNQRIHRFLQHAFFVADDNFRRVQVHQTAQTVVAIDHAAVQVVEVGGRKTTAIQLHHWA